MNNIPDYISSTRMPAPTPDSIVENGKVHFGTFDAPFQNLNLLDAVKPCGKNMPDFMKLLSGGIKKGEGGLISQIKSMAAKVQQGMEGISSFSLPELTLPHFDGSGWNFPQAALAGGGTTRTTNLGGVYITVNGYNARNDDELAQTVADKINGMIHEDDSVFK